MSLAEDPMGPVTDEELKGFVIEACEAYNAEQEAERQAVLEQCASFKKYWENAFSEAQEIVLTSLPLMR